MYPIIGIPCRLLKIEKSVVYDVFAVSCDYVQAVTAAGGVPMLIPIVQYDNFAILDALYARCNGLLFQGGEDVNPKFYDEEPDSALGNTSEARDLCDLYLMKRAINDGKPILGICRGLQIANIALGGSLYQDISLFRKDLKHPITDWREFGHSINIEAGTKLSQILQVDRMLVNSLHHQCIKRLGNGLRVSAIADDGVIEGVEIKDPEQYLVGVQCHPETLYSEKDTLWLRLFSDFARACSMRFGS